LIEPRDIDELLGSSFTSGIPQWCVENGVEERALLRVAETYGSDSKTAAAVVCAFQLGYEACKRHTTGRSFKSNGGSTGQ
jgi:hypothetical protein